MMKEISSIVYVLCYIVLLKVKLASSLAPPFATLVRTNNNNSNPKASTSTSIADDSNDLPSVVSRVAVAGATGRLGRLVVQDLLDRGVPNVVAVVRDPVKALEIFPNPPSNLEIIACDLMDTKQIPSTFANADAVIWCATGFTDSSDGGPLQQVQRLINLALKRNIDTIGLPSLAKFLAAGNVQSKGKKRNMKSLPKIVMCSSAGVTRLTWDETKKQAFPGAADIPIVRLNPFGILDVKRASEELLRSSGVPYSIIRPAGLNDKWPAGSRPVLSQGDVAVGRIHRKDVASVLVDVLSMPEATGKTFEILALNGYPKAVSIRPALERLLTDEEGLPPIESIAATYHAMQQLLPGEKQASAALAMGQTYEELDQGKTGRLGERGRENIALAAPKPSS